MDEIVDKIDELRRTSFTVSSIPISTLKQFKEFCQRETGGSYALGITFLLRIFEMWGSITPLLSSILSDIEQLKKQQSNSKSKRELKTFGEDN